MGEAGCARVVTALVPCARSADPVTSQIFPGDSASGAPWAGCTQLKLPSVSCLGVPCGRELWLRHTTTPPWKGCPLSMFPLLLVGCFKKPDTGILFFSLSFSLVPHSGLSITMDTSQ